MRVLRYASLQERPWKNGGGVTREIAAGPGWRVAIATIDRDGPFSDFSGFDRTIVPLEGAGFTLAFGDGESVTLERLYEPFRFAGERAAQCRLLDGSSRDLNVMSERARWSHDVRAIELSARERPFAAVAPAVLVAMRGCLRARYSGGALELAAGDAIACESDERFELSGDGAIALAIAFVLPRG